MALDMFEEMISRYRMLWLSGRYGGGKTSLAAYLAGRLCHEGWTKYITSNTPLRLKEVARLDPRDVHDVTDTVLLMDESWRYVGEGREKHVSEWMAYMRKKNQVLLMPSVMKVARQLRMLRVERRFNGLGFGLPFWWYTWFLDGATGKEKQHWIWWRPTRIFALYDHSLPEMDEFAVYEWAPPVDLEIEANDNEHNEMGSIEGQDGSDANVNQGKQDQLADVRYDHSLPVRVGSGRPIPLLQQFRRNRQNS